MKPARSVLFTALATCLTFACQDRAPAPTLPTSIQLVTAPQAAQFQVTGTAKVEVVPDCAEVQMAVAATAPTTAAASTTQKEKLRQLRVALAAAGIADQDVKLSSARIHPADEYDDRGRVIRRQFAASVNLVVTTRDFQKISTIMEAGASAGISTMSTSFRSEKLDELKRQARDMALDAAKAKATQMTSRLGVKLGAVIALSESPGGHMWQSQYMSQANVSVAAPDAQPAVAVPETQAITLEVAVTYALPG